MAYNEKTLEREHRRQWRGSKLIDKSCRNHGTFSRAFFPDLTWENEPIEVEFRPAITDLDTKAKEYANNITNNEELREMIITAFKAGYNT